MYIEPSTIIRILKDVPLDNSYDHTIYFASKSAQTSYFQRLTKYNLQRQTYQRVKRGRIRVGIVSDNLYDCNYVMFQNSGFGDKWFYAFIRNVEYINNECSEIEFEIDVMQTWHFDYSVDHCFVEREHVTDDAVGNHIEPEGVEVGEYVMSGGYDTITDLTDMCVIIAIVDTSDQITQGNLYEGIYGGAQLYVYESTDVDGINSKVEEYLQKPSAILSMYMCPTRIVGAIPESHKLGFGASGWKIDVEKAQLNPRVFTLDGYTPKNNKMFTYPYNFYHVDNAQGNSLTLRYEFFDNSTPTFQISGTITQPVSLVLRPTGYKNSGRKDALAGTKTWNAESLTLSNYPLCSWNVDAYQAWIAQNTIPTLLNIGGAVASMGASSGMSIAQATTPQQMGSQAIGVLGSTLNLVTSTLSSYYRASIQSDIHAGSFDNGGGNVSNRKQQFWGGQCCVTAQYARMIDDFFTMYGYAIRKIKIPNRSARPHWNFVKTIGATLTGSVPCDDMKKICVIYDSGITFWNNGNEIGNYNLDNSLEVRGGEDNG